MATTTHTNEFKNDVIKPAPTAGNPVADKIKDTLHTSVDTLAQKAAETERSIREGARSGSESVSAKQRELEAKWEQSPVKKYVTENPVASAGIAFAAGVLLTAILKRS